MIKKLLCKMGIHIHSYTLDGFSHGAYFDFSECACGNVKGYAKDCSPARSDVTRINGVEVDTPHPEFERLATEYLRQRGLE